MEIKVLSLNDLESLLEFEQNLLKESRLPDFEKEMQAWHAKWRKEALEHYLPLGWSFCLKDKNSQIGAYFLAQPLVHFRGMTQTLWVEHIASFDEGLLPDLIDVAYRFAKEKHFQKLLIAKDLLGQQNHLTSFKVSKANDEFYEINTAKIV